MRDAGKPNAGGGKNDRAARAEPNQKRRGQIMPCAEGPRRRERPAEERIKRAGAGALEALLQDGFHGPGRARERGGAVIGTDDAPGGGGFGAIGAHGAPAPGAHGNGFRLMSRAFHAGRLPERKGLEKKN